MRVTDNTVLITGGSSGIGLALARRFLKFNNKVIIVGRDAQKLRKVHQENPQVDSYACDLSDQRSLAGLCELITVNHPKVNIVIHNAAVQYNYMLSEEPNFIQMVDQEIATNFATPVKLSVMLLPLLKKNGNAAIVNVSSGLFIAPKKSAAVYCATKAAIHSFTKTLRYQLEDTNVKVFEIIPSLVDTPMTQGSGKAKIQPEKLVDEFMCNFGNDKLESYIGKTKLLKLIDRVSPRLACRIMKNGL